MRDSVKDLGGSKPELSRRISDNRNGCILTPTESDLCQVFYKTLLSKSFKALCASWPVCKFLYFLAFKFLFPK